MREADKMSSVLSRIPQFEFPPRYGPEWGSGGIFGMKYHQGVLAYTLAFEAEVHFQREDTEKVYRYDLVGKPPRSGGDTYNAVEAVDDEIYFGGWVHAPAVYEGRTGKGGKILFNNKFSHLHSYDAKEDRVRLLWKDTLAHEWKWAGEVSQVVYDPVGDRLLIARADGHENLGVFAIDRRTGAAERISEIPALKGTPHLDHVCFDVRRDWTKGVEGIQTLDLVTGKWSVIPVDFAKNSVDGGGVYWPGAGCAISAYSRLFLFVRGGVLVGDPLGDLEGMKFVRLFDFGTDYSPSRTVCKAVGGGILVAFSAYSQSLLHPRNEFETGMKARANFINGPSVLVYITPPQVRVVGALGGRITSFEKVGDKLVVAGSTAANLSADDATPMDTGCRDLSVFDLGSILTGSPSVTYNVLGEHVMDGVWGGIPLGLRHRTEMSVEPSNENRMTIYEYDLGLPVDSARSEVIPVGAKKQSVDVSGYRGIVSFSFEKPDPRARIQVRIGPQQ
jgi:hypothetical protein